MIPGSDGRKMSKTLDNTIDLQDDPDQIRAKVRSFITDPQKVRRGDPGRPEVCPIFALHRRFSPQDVPRIDADCRTGELGCVDCKTILADHLIEELAPFRERRAELEADPGYLDEVLAAGPNAPARSPRKRCERCARRCTSPRGIRMTDAWHPAPTPPAQAGSFPVELPVFTGPFRMFADLILEQKVDVCDVRIAEVTDDYLARSKDAETWNLEEATWFLAICAVLLELKVARLTPKHTELDEDDLLGGSPDLVYARSLELAAFRKVAVEIARRLEDEAGYFARDVGPGPEFSHLYPDPMDPPEAGRPRSRGCPARCALRPPWICPTSRPFATRWPRP